MEDITKSLQKALQSQQTVENKAKEQLSQFNDTNIDNTLASIEATERVLKAKQQLDSLKALKKANDSAFYGATIHNPFLDSEIDKAESESMLAINKLQSIATQNELNKLEKLKQEAKYENIRQNLSNAYEANRLQQLPNLKDFTPPPVRSDWEANWKEMGTRFAGGLLGGTGGMLESAGNTWESIFAATFGTEEGDTWGERFNNRYNWAEENRTSTQDFFNAMARPFNEVRYKNNFQSMFMDLDGIKNEDGVFNTIYAAGKSIYDVIPSMMEGVIAGIPTVGTPAIMAMAIGEMNKERQATLLGKDPKAIMDVNSKYIDNIALMSAGLYTLGGKLEGAMLKRLITGRFFDSDVQKLQKAYAQLDKKMYIRDANGKIKENTKWLDGRSDKAKKIEQHNELKSKLDNATTARTAEIKSRQEALTAKKNKSIEFWDKLTKAHPIAGNITKYGVRGSKALGSVAGGLLTNAAMEGVSEGIQTIAEQTNRYKGKRYNIDEIIEASALGAIAGGTIGTISGTVDKFRNRADGRTIGEVLSDILKSKSNDDSMPNNDTTRKEINKALGLRDGSEIDKGLSQALGDITGVISGEADVQSLYELGNRVDTLANSENEASGINTIIDRVTKIDPSTDTENSAGIRLSTFGTKEGSESSNASLQGTIKAIEDRAKQLTGTDEATLEKKKELEKAIKELEAIQVRLAETATKDEIANRLEVYNSRMSEFLSSNNSSNNEIYNAFKRLLNRTHLKDNDNNKAKAEEQRKKDLSLLSSAAKMIAIARKYSDGKIKLDNGETLELASLTFNGQKFQLSQLIDALEKDSQDEKGNTNKGIKSLVNSRIEEAKKDKGKTLKIRDIAEAIQEEYKFITDAILSGKTNSPVPLLDALLRFSYMNSKEFQQYIEKEISSTLNSQVESLISEIESTVKDTDSDTVSAPTNDTDLKQDLSDAIDALKSIGVATNKVFQTLSQVLGRIGGKIKSTEKKIPTTDKIHINIEESIDGIKKLINKAENLHTSNKSPKEVENEARDLYSKLLDNYMGLLSFLIYQQTKLNTISRLYNSIVGTSEDLKQPVFRQFVKDILEMVKNNKDIYSGTPQSIYFYGDGGQLSCAVLLTNAKSKDGKKHNNVLVNIDGTDITDVKLKLNSSNSIYIPFTLSNNGGKHSLFSDVKDSIFPYMNNAVELMREQYTNFKNNVLEETTVLLPAIIGDVEVALNEVSDTYGLYSASKNIQEIDTIISNEDYTVQDKITNIKPIYNSLTSAPNANISVALPSTQDSKNSTRPIRVPKNNSKQKDNSKQSTESKGSSNTHKSKASIKSKTQSNTKPVRNTTDKKAKAKNYKKESQGKDNTKKEVFDISTAEVDPKDINISFTVGETEYSISDIDTDGDNKISSVISVILEALHNEYPALIKIGSNFKDSNNSYFYMAETTFRALFENVFYELLSTNDRNAIDNLEGLDTIQFFDRIKISKSNNISSNVELMDSSATRNILFEAFRGNRSSNYTSALKEEVEVKDSKEQVITNTDTSDPRSINVSATPSEIIHTRNEEVTAPVEPVDEIARKDTTSAESLSINNNNKITHTTSTTEDNSIIDAIDSSITKEKSNYSFSLRFNVQANGDTESTTYTYNQLKENKEKNPFLGKVLKSIIDYIRGVTIDLGNIVYIQPTDSKYNKNEFNNKVSQTDLENTFKDIFGKTLGDTLVSVNTTLSNAFNVLFKSYINNKVSNGSISNVSVHYGLLNQTTAIEDIDGNVLWQYGRNNNAETSPTPSAFVHINNAAALFLTGDKSTASLSPFVQQARVLATALLIRTLSDPVFLSKNETNEQLLERFSTVGSETDFNLKRNIAKQLRGSEVYNKVITDIGRQFMSVLNMELDPEKVRDGQVEQLQREIGAMILQVGVEAGLFTTTKIKRSDIANITGEDSSTQIVLVRPTDVGKKLIGLPVATKKSISDITAKQTNQTKVAQYNVSKFLEALGIEKVDDKLNYTTDESVALDRVQDIKSRIKNNKYFKLGKDKLIKLTNTLSRAISTLSRTGYTLQNVAYLNNLLFDVVEGKSIRSAEKVTRVAKALGFIDYESIKENDTVFYYKKHGDKSVIPAKDIESIETTNNQIINDLEALMNFLEAMHEDPTIYSTIRITANGRLHYQGGEIDIQSRPIFRFLFAPREAIIQDSLNHIRAKALTKGTNYDMFYVAIASSFGYSYDKQSHDNSVAVGREILKVFIDATKKQGTDFQGNPISGLTMLQQDILYAMEQGPGAKILTVEIDGKKVDLELEYASHTLTTMFQLLQLVANPSKELPVYIPIEVDSTNSGGALKTLQNFTSPLSLKLLRSVGIRFGTLSDRVKNEKVYDLYQQLGLALNDPEYFLTNESNIKNTDNSIRKAFKSTTSDKTNDDKLFKDGKIGTAVTSFLENYIFAVKDNEVTKILRSAMKSIGHPINYSAGLNGILNALNKFILDSLVSDVIKWKALEKNKTKDEEAKKAYDDFMSKNPSIQLLKSYLTTDLLDTDINKDVDKRFNKLLNEILTAEDLNQVYLKKVEGINYSHSISLINVTSDLFKVLMKPKVEHAIDYVYPGQREIGDNINASINDIFYMVNNITISLKESILAKRKEEDSSAYLTESEAIELNKKLAKLIPGIQLASITSSDNTVHNYSGILPFGDGRTTNVDLNPKNRIQIHLSSKDGKSDSSITIRSSQDAYNDAGAGGNVIEIHQLDGSIMTFIINNKNVTKQGKYGIEALFIAIHDALTTNFNNIVEHAQAMNESIYKTNSEYNLRQMNYDIALFAYDLAKMMYSTNLGIKSTANTDMSERFLARRMLGLAYQRVFVALGNHNSDIAYNADEIVINNANIGIDDGAYTVKGKGNNNEESIQSQLLGLDKGYIDSIKKEIRKENEQLSEDEIAKRAIEKTKLLDTLEDYELFNSIPDIIKSLSIGNYFDSNTNSVSQLDVDKAIVLCNKIADRLLKGKKQLTYSENSIYKDRVQNLRKSKEYGIYITDKKESVAHYSDTKDIKIAKSTAQNYFGRLGENIEATPKNVTSIVFTPYNITKRQDKNSYYPLASPSGKRTSGNILEAFSNPNAIADEIVNMIKKLPSGTQELYTTFIFDFTRTDKNKNKTTSPFNDAITFDQRVSLIAEILYLIESRIPDGKTLFIEVKDTKTDTSNPTLEAYILHRSTHSDSKIKPTTANGQNPVSSTSGDISIVLDNSRLYHAYTTLSTNDFLSATDSDIKHTKAEKSSNTITEYNLNVPSSTTDFSSVKAMDKNIDSNKIQVNNKSSVESKLQGISKEQQDANNRADELDSILLSPAEKYIINNAQAEETTLNNDIADDFADPDLVLLSTDLTSGNSAVNILNDLHNDDVASGEVSVANVSQDWLNTQRDMLNFIAENTNALVDVEVKKKNTTGPNSGKTRHTPSGKSTVLVKSSTRAAFAGFMTRAENYVHEIYHATTHYAIRYLGSSNPHVRQLFKLFNLVKNNLTEEKIINALPNNITNKEEVARVILKHMTAKNGDILTALEEFVAIGNSSEVIMTLLKNLKVKELITSEIDANGVFGKLVQNTRNLFKEFYSKLRFGIDKDMNAYEALQSLTKELAKINRQGIQQANKKKNKLAAFKTVIADKLDAKGRAMIDALIKKVNLTAYGLSTKYPGPDASTVQQLLFIARAIPVAMIDPNFRNLLSLAASHFPLFHDESFAQRILQDMFQNPKRKEVITSLRLLADAIDSQRNIMNTGVKASVQEFFTTTTEDGKKYLLSTDDTERTKLMKHMTLGILDTDMSALLQSGMSVKEIQRLMSDEQALKNAIVKYEDYLEADIKNDFDKIISKNGKNKINRTQYKRFLLNKADQLAYYMVTGDNRQPGLLVNAKAIADMILNTKFKVKASKDIVKKLDTYITLLALSKLDNEVKTSVADVFTKFNKGSKDLLSYMQAINKEYTTTFPDRVYSRKKGYRPPVLDSSYSFKLGTKQEEEILNSQGYTRIGEMIDKDTYIYVNSTFGANSTLNRTAMRYTTGEITTFNLKSVRNTKIISNPSNIDAYISWYNASIDELKKDVISNFNRSLNEDTRSDNTRANGDTRVATMIPIVTKSRSSDEKYSDIYYPRDFQYPLTKVFKEVSLGVNSNVFDVVADLTSSTFDEIQTKQHNEKVVDAIVADWTANKNEKAFSKRFIELSVSSQNEYIRDIAKLITTETMDLLKDKFKEKGSDKVMISTDMLVDTFGYRDMDIRNTKWYQTSKSPKVIKQIVAGSQALMRKIARSAKTEIVVKNSKVIIGNASSNTMTLLNYGVPFGEAFKSQFDAFLELEYYQKLQKDKVAWETKVKTASMVKEKEKAQSRVDEIQTQLENSDVHELMKAGLLPSIEDLENDSKDYFEKYYEDTYNKLPKIYKWLVDTLFITNKTELGKALYKLVHNSDFISRYALLKYLNRTKKPELIAEYVKKGANRDTATEMATRDVRATVRDAFIDYGKLPSRGFKAVEDAGFVMFSKYATRIQKVIFNDLARERPFRTLALLLGQTVSGINIEDSMDNTIFDRDFTNLMSSPFSNIYNAYLTPASIDELSRWVK